MGLLSHIEEADYQNRFSVSSLTFNEFQKKNSINLFGIYNKIDGNYVLTKSLGFDLNTISTSVFSTTLFDEILSEKSMLGLSKSDLLIKEFCESFSADFKNKFSYINLYKEKNTVYVIFTLDNSSDLKDIFDDLVAVNNTKQFASTPENTDVYFSYKISFDAAITKITENKIKGKFIKNTIFAQMLYELSAFFPEPNVIKQNDDFTCDLFIKAKNDISKSLLKIQLQNNFNSFINESSDLIEIL